MVVSSVFSTAVWKVVGLAEKKVELMVALLAETLVLYSVVYLVDKLV